jgi:hypothetical protein
VGNAKSLDPYGTAYSYMADTDFPRNITVLYTSAMPTLDKTTKINLSSGLYIHHTFLADMIHEEKDFLGCEKTKANPIPISIFNAGGLYPTDFKFANLDDSFQSGYHIQKDAKILNNVDIVNYDKVAKDLYMVIELEYLPGKPANTLSAQHANINLGMCDTQDGLNVHGPQGQTKWSLRGSEMIVTRDGLPTLVSV